MKKKLYQFLPKFITTHKYGDKFAHAIYGTLIYLILLMLVDPSISLFLTWSVAMGVEVIDMKTHKGDFKDFLSTILIPTLIYIIFI